MNPSAFPRFLFSVGQENAPRVGLRFFPAGFALTLALALWFVLPNVARADTPVSGHITTPWSFQTQGEADAGNLYLPLIRRGADAVHP